MDDKQVDAFSATLRGQLITRSRADCEEARGLYNAMIDMRPLSIARCTDVGDAIDQGASRVDHAASQGMTHGRFS